MNIVRSKLPFIISALLSLVSLLSCSGHSDTIMIKEFNKSLSHSNETIKHSTEILYRSIESRSQDTKKNEKAIFWNEKAVLAKTATKEILQYVNGLRATVKREANLTLENGMEKYDENARSKTFSRVFSSGEFYNRWDSFVSKILNVDEDFLRHFKLTAPYHLSQKIYGDKTALEAVVILEKKENDALNFENEIAKFCHEKSAPIIGCGFGSGPHLLVSQNLDVLKPGQEFEVKAGVGTFFSEVKPVFTINGKGIKLNDVNMAVFKFKTPNKPGKYKMPVTVDITDDDGKLKTMTKIVEYEIIAE